MTTCQICESSRVAMLLDFGKQPICNRFVSSPDEPEHEYPIAIGQCQDCGLVQLATPPVPGKELRPRVEWITYREPEAHLDRLADAISRLPGLTNRSVIAGVSFKDDSLLERLRAWGFSQIWRMDTEQDLGISGKGAGVETIQDRLEVLRCDEIWRRHGRADILIARHILEHAHDVQTFTVALHTLLNPGGYLVLEVPDCTPALETCDYTTIWEEHTLYLTPETFTRYCRLSRLEIVAFHVFPYTMENSLIAVGRFREEPSLDGPSERTLQQELARARSFTDQFAARRERIKQVLVEFRKTRGKIALFGAGHLSCAFINLLQLKPWIDFVVDDHPNKQGLLMPGSRLPIRSSAALLTEEVRLCLLGMGPESEEKVIQRNARFLERGGRFASILTASRRPLDTLPEFHDSLHTVQATQ